MNFGPCKKGVSKLINKYTGDGDVIVLLLKRGRYLAPVFESDVINNFPF